MNAITKHYIDGTFVECSPEYYPKHRKPEMFQPGAARIATSGREWPSGASSLLG